VAERKMILQDLKDSLGNKVCQFHYGSKSGGLESHMVISDGLIDDTGDVNIPGRGKMAVYTDAGVETPLAQSDIPHMFRDTQ
jgi:hypothetical protein